MWLYITAMGYFSCLTDLNICSSISCSQAPPKATVTATKWRNAAFYFPAICYTAVQRCQDVIIKYDSSFPDVNDWCIRRALIYLPLIHLQTNENMTAQLITALQLSHFASNYKIMVGVRDLKMLKCIHRDGKLPVFLGTGTSPGLDWFYILP